MRAGVLSLGFALSLVNASLALAAPPAEAERGGRFIMQPVEGGVLRMDSETGAMSLCTRVSGTLACAPVADERGNQKEIERLALENRELKAQNKRLEDLLADPAKELGGGDPRGDRHARRSPKFELPSEEDVDKALGYLDRMIKKFRERMRDFDGGGGRGTPL